MKKTQKHTPAKQSINTARLNKAAPDLLKACEDTLNTLNQMTTHEFQRGGDKAIRAQLKAAILKATEEK